jgi:hypothetical protein
MIRFACPSCGVAACAPEDCAGRSTNCRKCRNRITVPSVAPPPVNAADWRNQPPLLQNGPESGVHRGGCPKCKTAYQLGVEHLGKVVICPSCKARFTAPTRGHASSSSHESSGSKQNELTKSASDKLCELKAGGIDQSRMVSPHGEARSADKEEVIDVLSPERESPERPSMAGMFAVSLSVILGIVVIMVVMVVSHVAPSKGTALVGGAGHPTTTGQKKPNPGHRQGQKEGDKNGPTALASGGQNKTTSTTPVTSNQSKQDDPLPNQENAKVNGQQGSDKRGESAQLATGRQRNDESPTSLSGGSRS